MPKVSDAHRAARRRQILDAAGRCFMRNGFHATSMQDVFRESGLSAGAVYRYFPSKSAIVTAIAEETVAGIIEEIEEVTTAEPVRPAAETMARVLAVADAYTGPGGAARLALQVWAESLREPALAEFVAATYRQLRSRFVEWARRAQAAGMVPAGADPGQVGAVLFGMVPGYVLQRVLVGGVDPAGYAAGLRALLDAAGAEATRAAATAGPAGGG